ncbi:DUF6985 domain-containing protein [Gimesia maris]|uniref:DUF6985 domain-containing protein n=1 Tax=Gimesia maris TaxID=122 RepID=UPI0030DCA5DB|tara:strand:- start:25913 stop:26848 length:936 start_codon:yes stop_codon:yes gene_type:complete
MSIIDKMNYAPEYEAWVGEVSLTGFESCGIMWDCDVGHISKSPNNPKSNNGPVTLPLHIDTVEESPPTKAQKAAFDFLLDNQNQIAKVVLEYSFEQAKIFYYSDSLPDSNSLGQEQKALRESFDTLDGFCQLVNPVSITILKEAKGNTAYFAIDFVTSLDAEHGFSVLIHRQNPIGWGGIGESGGGLPVIQEKKEEDPFQKWVESEKKYLELLSKITDLASVERFSEDLANCEAESFLNDNRYCREVITKPKLNNQISSVIEQRILELQRIRKQYPEAFDRVALIREMAIKESSEILDKEHEEWLKDNESD